MASLFDTGPLPAGPLKAFVIVEMKDGSAVAYAIEHPEEVSVETQHHYARGFDPFFDMYRVDSATHSLTFDFRNALGYTSIRLAPGAWGGFNFDRPAIEAGDSHD
ncbi:hypothetical protein [Arthrobacter sp. HY1533]|uniref:hypothetical protein n=1 Tax=Arthrobacter sp. HY1533 TaxID=2970919 RepID=UPI0022B9D8D2|nr:hypothetical protein [Arthrobacter sp. HY1533]